MATALAPDSSQAAIGTTTQCCIAGGGPAGMMLGYLLARAGVRTIVLEKHADFLRDFRGDTVHPSTLRIMDELGLLDAFLRRPHRRLAVLGGWFGQERVQLGDFRWPADALRASSPSCRSGSSSTSSPARRGSCRRSTLQMRAEVTGLVEADGRVAGVRGTSSRGRVRDPRRLHRRLRRSPLDRAGGGAASRSRTSARRSTCSGFASAATRDGRRRPGAGSCPGHFIVTIDRGDYWQCAFVIPKGGAEALRRQASRSSASRSSRPLPMLAPRIGETSARGTTSSCSPSRSTG